MEFSEEKELELKNMVNHLEKLLVEKAYEEAISSAKKCLSNYSSDTMHYGIAKINSIIGFSHYYLNRLDEAILSFELAAGMYQNIDPTDWLEIIHVKNSLCTFYRLRGKYLLAFRSVKESIEISERFNINNATGYNNLGIIYNALNEHDMAIFNFKRAIELANASKNLNQSNLNVYSNNLSNSYLQIGELRKAKTLYSRVLEDENSNDFQKMQANKGLGLLYINDDKLDTAKRFLEISLKLSKKLNNKIYLVYILEGLADIYEKKGSESNYEQSLLSFCRVAKKFNEKKYITALERLVDFYLKSNQFFNAVKYKSSLINLKKNRVNNKDLYQIKIEFNMVRLKYLLEREYRFREKLEKKNRRLSELLRVNNQLSYRVELLHKQLKPSFIFNTLQDIQNMAIQGDRVSASDHIASLANLMRMILHHARQNRVQPRRSFVLLKRFIELLSCRQKNYIQYDLELEEENEDFDFGVPPFFISTLVLDWINENQWMRGDKLLIKLKCFEKSVLLSLNAETSMSNKHNVDEPEAYYFFQNKFKEYWNEYANLEGYNIAFSYRDGFESNGVAEIQII